MPAPPPNQPDFLSSLDIFKDVFLTAPSLDFTMDFLTLIWNEFGSFITAFETYTKSGSFPNVNVSDYDHDLYHLTFMDILKGDVSNGVIWKGIPNCPDILMVGGTLKQRKSFNQFSEIKAKHIINNVSGSVASLGIKWGANGTTLMPYPNAISYNRILGLMYDDGGGKFKATPLALDDHLRLKSGKIETYTAGAWVGVDLPRRPDDLHAASLLPAAEGDVRAKAGDVGLEVYRGSAWQDLWIF